MRKWEYHIISRTVIKTTHTVSSICKIELEVNCCSIGQEKEATIWRERAKVIPTWDEFKLFCSCFYTRAYCTIKIESSRQVVVLVEMAPEIAEGSLDYSHSKDNKASDTIPIRPIYVYK